jgi:hypothetical protein
MDNLDSKMEAMRAHFEREADLESPWTSYNASLGRPLLNSSKFLAPKVTPPADSSSLPEPDPEGESERSGASREETPDAARP